MFTRQPGVLIYLLPLPENAISRVTYRAVACTMLTKGVHSKPKYEEMKNNVEIILSTNCIVKIVVHFALYEQHASFSVGRANLMPGCVTITDRIVMWWKCFMKVRKEQTKACADC